MEFFFVLSIAFMFLSPGLREVGTTYEIYNEELIWIAFVIAGGAYLIVHTLKAVGLYRMAKKKGMGKKLLWCAFVPFANTFLMGELGGKFGAGKGIKHIGLYVMIVEILYCAAAGVYYGLTGYALMNGMYGLETYESGQYTYWRLVYEVSLQAERVMNVFYYLEYIFSFLNLFASVFLYIVFFRKYAPASYIWMVVLCALIPLFTGPLVFAFRNRSPIDYDAFMRARYEQIRRQQQQYYSQQNPYGQNPYGQNPYGQNPYGTPENGQQSGTQGDDDPFGEFSGGGNGSSSGDGSSGSDSGGSQSGNGQGGSGGSSDDGLFN